MVPLYSRRLPYTYKMQTPGVGECGYSGGAAAHTITTLHKLMSSET